MVVSFYIVMLVECLSIDSCSLCIFFFFFFQAEDGIRDVAVTGVQTCALPISQQPERNVSTLRRVYDAIHADGRRAAARTRQPLTTRKCGIGKCNVFWGACPAEKEQRGGSRVPHTPVFAPGVPPA